MTIELLLTMQGQGANSSSSSSAAPGSPRAAQGMFLQAFTQAASQQARPLTSAQAENAPKVSLSDIVEQLASLDSELDEETLSSIVATVSTQGQATDIFSSGTDSVALAQTLETASAAREQARAPEQASSSPASEGTETIETTTQMTIAEVASRLALIASYSTPSTANPAGSSAQSANPATPSAASLSKATTQTSPNQRAPANTLTTATSFLDRTPLAIPAALSDHALATEPTQLARLQGQVHTQALTANQPATPQTSTAAAANSAVSSAVPPANGQVAILQVTPANAAPRDVQVAQTGERAAAEAPRATTPVTVPQPTLQATAPPAPSTINSGTPQSLGLPPTPNAGSAPVMPPVTANGTATTLKATPTSAAPRDVRVAQTGERAATEAPRTTTPATAPQPTIQTTAPPAPSTINSGTPQGLGLSPTPNAGSAPVMPPVTANGTATTLKDTPASAAPRDWQVALTGKRAVAEAPRTTTPATVPQPTIQATAPPAPSTTNSGTPQGLSLPSTPNAGSASVMPPVTTNGTAAALQGAPTSAVRVAQTGERAAIEAPRTTTPATPATVPQPTLQATALPAPSTTNSGTPQGLGLPPTPNAGSASVMPSVTANGTATTLQGTPTSAGQIAQTGERAAVEAPRTTTPATAPQPTTQATAPPAPSTTNSGTPQGLGLSPVPSAVSASEMPPLTANGTAATLQDAPTSVVPRDGQVAQAGERVVAETSQATTQASTNAAASVMPPLPVTSSATSSATTLPNNTGELAQSAVGSSLTSALAATAQQAVGATNASRPSSVKALPAEAATTPVNAPTLAASLETIPAQPFTSMQPGMHALSPLNTALAPTVNADAMASLFAEAEAASVTSGASKGSEQALPASLTSPNQAMPNSPATATLNTPLTSPAWPSQLGQQLIQFAQRGGEHQVKMQLHPAELGPLSITLKVTEQGTQAHFLSSHAPVRQAIEQAIPQLREALAEQGISLGETSVGEQQTPNEQAFAQQTPGKAAGNRGGELGSDSAPSPTEVDVQGSPDGRVDLYA
ncbi:flagellar hook-length control protein FliK [Halomonas sp. KG2]|uniref:flagellar hook-length control protein FliK n=1 Tax=Halomonas sp. KG2 TaxID=2951138 RepID=UPI002649C60F|nr:flagellar hook-length control protein FliK [Halomonas sp. KG2]WKD28455.1 flagellar hook-length control protein FliK [Halomonas sp. KG2]